MAKMTMEFTDELNLRLKRRALGLKDVAITWSSQTTGHFQFPVSIPERE
jgi:hypothetical protein